MEKKGSNKRKIKKKQRKQQERPLKQGKRNPKTS